MKTTITLAPRLTLLALLSCSPSSTSPVTDGGSDASTATSEAGDVVIIPVGPPDGSSVDAPSGGVSSADATNCSPPTSLACSGACVDPTIPAHCGTCGNPCAAPATGTGSATCTSGTCGVSCSAGYAASGSDCVATDLYVSVATGSDGNPGTLMAPLKTITHALALAQGATAVHVFAGTYSEWSASSGPVTIHDAVTVESYGGGTVILAGPGALDAGTSQAVAINDSGTLRAVTIQGYDVPIGVSGSGSALLDTVNTVNNAQYIDDSGTGTLTAVNCHLGPVDTAVAAGSTPTFVMHSGTLAAGTEVCGSGYGPLVVSDGATVALTDVTIDDSAGDLVYVVGGSVAMTGTMLTGNCAGMAIYQGAVAELTDVTSVGTIGTSGILEMNGGSVSGMGAPAVQSNSATTGELPTIVMRNVTLVGSGGVLLLGPGAYDLGTSYSPGGNTFSGLTQYAISLHVPGVGVTAVGNTWLPGLQGADASGHLATGTSVAGPLGCPAGPVCNFDLFDATDSITF